jgi:hypothetical protein
MPKIKFEYGKRVGFDPDLDLELEGYKDTEAKFITKALVEMVKELKEVQANGST